SGGGSTTRGTKGRSAWRRRDDGSRGAGIVLPGPGPPITRTLWPQLGFSRHLHRSPVLVRPAVRNFFDLTGTRKRSSLPNPAPAWQRVPVAAILVAWETVAFRHRPSPARPLA